jgi:phenylacetate-CoA ligase
VDRVEVQVEVPAALLTGDVGRLLRVQNLLRERLQNDLGVSAEVKLVEPRTIGPAEHPWQRILDRRRAEGGESTGRE